jgi:hypothetical protein
MTTLTTPPGVAAELERIASGNHGDPHRLLGIHKQDDRWSCGPGCRARRRAR